MTIVSVIIATYNRSKDLIDCLDSLLKQEVKGDFIFEIIVVDNNSSDDTKKVLSSYVERFPGKIRYIFEGQQGKCYALNNAIAQAKGEIIALTDDDIIPDKDYFSRIAKAISECDPAIGIIGGKIIPIWMGEKPQWVYGPLLGPLALLDYGDKPFVLNSQTKDLKFKLFFGANLIVRKKLFEDFGGFDVKKVVAEDTEICQRFYDAGAQGLYDPLIQVHHKVPVSRTRPEYFYRWYYNHGKYRELTYDFNKKCSHLFGVPVWLIRQIIVSYLKSLFEKDQHARIYSRCMIYFNFGQLERSKIEKGKKQP